ncbi:hypothetical protein GOBAR_AA04688 [Gossypium barbadense]|uniref:Uncharacterized protein n=1 Tax=Gossypium barbadense TaxID=3634 RepID=A0A2P5YK37_GOSBA|nr:hypothetical protein GOBAR_AA04688 [Gossypium barbadense]
MNWTRGWWWLSRWVLVLWGDIIRNVLVGLLLGRLREMILGRVPQRLSIILMLSMLEMPCGDIWPMRVRDDSWATGWLEKGCLGAARIVRGQARGQSVPALRGREMPRVAPNSGTLNWQINLPRWNVEQSSIVNSRYVGSIILKNNYQGSVVRRARIASAI